MNPYVKSIAISIFVAVVISLTLTSYWWLNAVILLLLQFAVSWFASPVQIVVEPDQDQLNQIIADVSTTDVTCPCGKSFEAPLYLNHDNDFKCPHCHNAFRVELVPTPVLLTETVNTSASFELFQQLGGAYMVQQEQEQNYTE